MCNVVKSRRECKQNEASRDLRSEPDQWISLWTFISTRNSLWTHNFHRLSPRIRGKSYNGRWSLDYFKDIRRPHRLIDFSKWLWLRASKLKIAFPTRISRWILKVKMNSRRLKSSTRGILFAAEYFWPELGTRFSGEKSWLKKVALSPKKAHFAASQILRPNF